MTMKKEIVFQHDSNYDCWGHGLKQKRGKPSISLYQYTAMILTKWMSPLWADWLHYWQMLHPATGENPDCSILVHYCQGRLLQSKSLKWLWQHYYYLIMMIVIIMIIMMMAVSLHQVQQVIGIHMQHSVNEWIPVRKWRISLQKPGM